MKAKLSKMEKALLAECEQEEPLFRAWKVFNGEKNVPTSAGNGLEFFDYNEKKPFPRAEKNAERDPVYFQEQQENVFRIQENLEKGIERNYVIDLSRKSYMDVQRRCALYSTMVKIELGDESEFLYLGDTDSAKAMIFISTNQQYGGAYLVCMNEGGDCFITGLEAFYMLSVSKDEKGEEVGLIVSYLNLGPIMATGFIGGTSLAPVKLVLCSEALRKTVILREQGENQNGSKQTEQLDNSADEKAN